NANNGDGNTKAESNESSDDALQVVTSFTIIADVANEIGGEDVDIHNLVTTGTDPHEYEQLPEDIKKAKDADVLFYNGLNLKGENEIGSDDVDIHNLVPTGTDHHEYEPLP